MNIVVTSIADPSYKGTGKVSEYNGVEICKLTSSMRSTMTVDGHQKHVTVPIGFRTDFGTIPKWAQKIVHAKGKGKRAYVLHDFLCQKKQHPRSYIDKCLLAALKFCKVPFKERWIAYISVRLYVIFIETFSKSNRFGDSK